jgi:hypothetical protein
VKADKLARARKLASNSICAIGNLIDTLDVIEEVQAVASTDKRGDAMAIEVATNEGYEAALTLMAQVDDILDLYAKRKARR